MILVGFFSIVAIGASEDMLNGSVCSSWGQVFSPHLMLLMTQNLCDWFLGNFVYCS